MSEIERGVQHSISTIRRSVEAYVFKRDDSAYRDGRLVTLPVWLDEPFVHNNDGAVLKVRTVLQDIADREGAHIISLNPNPPKR